MRSTTSTQDLRKGDVVVAIGSHDVKPRTVIDVNSDGWVLVDLPGSTVVNYLYPDNLRGRLITFDRPSVTIRKARTQASRKHLYRAECVCGWHSRWFKDGNMPQVFAERHMDRTNHTDIVEVDGAGRNWGKAV